MHNLNCNSSFQRRVGLTVHPVPNTITPEIFTIILLKSVCLSVGVRKRQVAILARSSREMSLTVRIVWQYILSRVRVSVRPSIFFTCEKLSKPRGNLAASASVYLALAAKGQRPVIVNSGVGRHGWLASNSDTATAVCMCVGGCRRSRGCVCTRAPVRACVREVFAIYDNTIWHRLMIIKYYSIFHTNHTQWWFPSTGTRLVINNSLSQLLKRSQHSFATIIRLRRHECLSTSQICSNCSSLPEHSDPLQTLYRQHISSTMVIVSSVLLLQKSRTIFSLMYANAALYSFTTSENALA